MPIHIYGHPFSSYCQKVFIALYENGTPFELLTLGADEDVQKGFAALWPMQKMPVLRENGRTVVETTIIIEYLDLHHPGPVTFIPADARAALPVRMLDRFFDNYVSTPMQRIVADFMRAPEARDPQTVNESRALLDKAYQWLDGEMRARTWAAGDDFTLADCAAGPALFYADWVHPIAESLGAVRAYRQRLLERPSFARAIDEARPFRTIFPPGAPDRD
jgi:glutathione S-transferase